MPVERKKTDDTKVRKLKLLPPTVFDLAEKYLNKKYEFRKNTVTDAIEIRQRDSDVEFIPLEDESDLFIELQKQRIKLSKENLKAILRSSFVSKYDPFEHYFDSLATWSDKEGDIIDRTANYIKVKKNDRTRFNTQFKKMLVRVIACALNPKVFNKHVHCLITPKQNTGKTSFYRWLCPPELKEYYSENINTSDKDSLIALTENFLINLDELAKLHKQEIARLKSFISKIDDKSRRPYGLRSVRRLRRVSFVASDNNLDFLTDFTGNVRWIIFHIDSIDFNYSKDIDINRLWAQAYYLYKDGFSYELSREEIAENETMNMNFMKVTPEIEVISRYFNSGTKDDYDYFLTATDINQVLIQSFNLRNIPIVRIGHSMSYLKFPKDSQYQNGLKKSYSVKGYYVKLDYGEKYSKTIESFLNIKFDKNTKSSY